MTIRYLKHTFHGGELSPNLRGRGDAPVYKSGLSRARNVLCTSVGDVGIRPGTRFMEEIPESPPTDDLAVMIPFPHPQGDVLMVLTDFKADHFDLDDTIGTAFNSSDITPWGASELRDVRWAQSFDTLILVHGDVPFQKMVRAADGTFSIAQVDFVEDGIEAYEPYAKLHGFGISAQASATTGTVTITLSGAHFAAEHLGVIIRLKGKRVELTSVNTTTSAVGLALDTLDDTSATLDWDEQVWSDYAGWPRNVAFFGQRLVFAGTPTLPDGVWMSKVGDYFNFDIGTSDPDDAIWTTLGTTGIAEIRGLLGLDDLLFLTDKGAMSTMGDVTPEGLGFRRQHSVPAAAVMPQEVDGAVVYVAENGVVNEMEFTDTTASYSLSPISTLASHLFDEGTTVRTTASFATFGVPDRHVFLLQDDGSVVVGHSNSAERVLGWQKWSVTAGKLLDIVTLRDRVFAIVSLAHQSGAAFLCEFDADYSLDVAVKTASASSLFYEGAIDAGQPVASAENFVTQPFDLTDAAWTGPSGGTGTEALDAVGIGGAATTASTIGDTDATAVVEWKDAAISVDNAGVEHVTSLWVLKDAVGTFYPELQVRGNLDATAIQVRLNLETGALFVANGSPIRVRLIDEDEWWALHVNHIPTATTGGEVRIKPANGLKADLTDFDLAATGEIVVGYVAVVEGTEPLRPPFYPIEVLSQGAWQELQPGSGAGLVSFSTTFPTVEGGYAFDWQAKSLPPDVLLPEFARSERWVRIVRAIPFLSETWRFRLNGVDVSLPASKTGTLERRLLGYSREMQVDFTQGSHPGSFRMVALELELSE